MNYVKIKQPSQLGSGSFDFDLMNSMLGSTDGFIGDDASTFFFSSKGVVGTAAVSYKAALSLQNNGKSSFGGNSFG